MVTYQAMTDGDLMQIHEGREVGRLGVKLAPDTQNLFVAAPEMLEVIREVLFAAENSPDAQTLSDCIADGIPIYRAAIAKATGQKE